MSFKVDWNSLETDSLRSWTKDLLQEALNSGKRPSILASQISIKDLNFGKVAPDFEILEIGELDKDRFRGIFKINYDGDFSLTLNTKVEGNPLKIYSENSFQDDSQSFVTPDFLLSNDSFNIPLDLKLSQIKILGIGILVFSKTKGLTLVFKNDPLDGIKVSSTFDNVKVLANFLQIQIENQIRDLFRETLPTVIHQLSLKYILRLSSSHEFLNNLHEKLLDIDLDDVDKVSFNEMKGNNGINGNLIKVLKLFNSREKLDLKIPKFKDVIQRSHLEKFNKNFAPSLSHSLNIPTAERSNGIPISVLIQQEGGGVNEYNKIDNTLNKISNIQLTNFYQSSNNSKPKRRVIKIRKNKNKEGAKASEAGIESTPMSTASSTVANSVDSSPKKVATEDSTPVVQPANVESTEMTKTSSIHHPVPLKVPQDFYHDLIKQKPQLKDLVVPATPTSSPYTHSRFHYNTSPVNSNSSLLSGLGLGNNYFNFTTSPTETTPSNTSIALTNQERDKIEEEIRKSINYININEVIRNKNLKKLQQHSKNNIPVKRANNSLFQDLPPPYYQV